MVVRLGKKELVGHARNVIAHDDVPRFFLRKLFIGGGHRPVMAQVVNEKLLQALHGAVTILGNGGMIVDVREEEALEFADSRSRGIAETGERVLPPPEVVHAGDAGSYHAMPA